ncbi:DUF3560 domain-containing protein [Intestinimonas butyriciproducens]|uniref:DUF3560 domain-containing protein n=1 Tax=Intestinimonas butyriciproducens TaxID=1297617 RepID=UPI0024320EC4|nr:DUF3560 domain-containing protein [Intestinimonas butyriciproducens]MCI6362901.1 DUF3560 domain-containing protein [Intestinimonas butyriciproducens]
MNDYEDKKQARIDYYREQAEKARAESGALSREASKMLEAIPLGQPLMPDHYSYKSDQRYRERAWNKQAKAVEAERKAAYYEGKAEAAELNTAISSDDPEAIEKLRTKLAGLEDWQSHMKRVNAYYRKNGTCLGCEGLTPDQALKLDHAVETGYSWEKCPYPSYQLSNNNQEIHRIRGRIQRLEAARSTEHVGWDLEGGSVSPNQELNRLQIFFDEKPAEELRAALKSGGFRWAPSEKAWQRQLNRQAIYAAGRIPALRPLSGEDPLSLQPRPPRREPPARGGPQR